MWRRDLRTNQDRIVLRSSAGGGTTVQVSQCEDAGKHALQIEEPCYEANTTATLTALELAQLSVSNTSMPKDLLNTARYRSLMSDARPNLNTCTKCPATVQLSITNSPSINLSISCLSNETYNKTHTTYHASTWLYLLLSIDVIETQHWSVHESRAFNRIRTQQPGGHQLTQQQMKGEP